MVNSRQLERALESAVNSQNFDAAEKEIDSYLDKNLPVDSMQSSRLCDALSKLELTPVTVEALIRLAPCIVHQEQLREWFDRLAPFALDSGGRDNQLVKQSREFLRTVLNGEFFFAGEETEKTYHDNSIAVFEWLVDVYVGHKRLQSQPGSDPTTYWSEERMRFVRYNCREMMIDHGGKSPEDTFNVLNSYLLEPKYRLDVIQLASELVVSRQNAKLFKVGDTPFFDSLLKCLEYDKLAPVLSVAASTMAVLLPHLCDRLVPVLSRLYACFGRLCSWQPPNESPEGHRASNVDADIWSVLYEDAETERTIEDGPKVDTLFTFLYGLFPQNTLVFCRQADEYLGTMEYQRPFSDFWSRFMVHHRAELLVPNYTVHRLLLSQTIEQERRGANQRWQSFQSTVALVMSCTDLRVPDPYDLVNSTDSKLEELFSDHQQQFEMVLARTTASHNATPLLGTPQSSATLSPTPTVNSSNSLAFAQDDAFGFHSWGRNSHIIAQSNPSSPQLDPQGTASAPRTGSQSDESAAFYRRELLLNKNELNFANFSRYISERRSIRLRKQLDALAIVRLRNDELNKLNKQLRQSLITLEEQSARSQRSARTLLRERNAYESTLIDKNRALREQISKSKEEIRDLIEQKDQAIDALKEARAQAQLAETTTSETEVELEGLRQRYEGSSTIAQDISDAPPQLIENNVNVEETELARAHLEIQSLREEAQRAKVQHASELAGLRKLINRQSQTTTHAVESNPVQVLDPDENLRKSHTDLIRRYAVLQRELEARQVHEEERLNELRSALMSARPFEGSDNAVVPGEHRFRGRGGAQGKVRLYS